MLSNWNPYDYHVTFVADVNKATSYGLKKMIITSYFVLTTLSTVGYGDLKPLNNWEKILGIFLIIIGIAFFSYIMQNFNDVLIDYDEQMGFVDYGSDLQVWLNSLSKFTSKKPLPRSLVKRIDHYFRFYWKNDK